MRKRKKVHILLLLFFLILVLTACGSEEDEADPFDFSGIEPKDLIPWTYVEDTSITLNGALRNLASSSAELGIVVGVVGIVFSIIYMAIRICFSKSAAVREEIKREAFLKGMIAVMLFSIPFWLGLFKMFAELLI